jgi:hypothetical protein
MKTKSKRKGLNLGGKQTPSFAYLHKYEGGFETPSSLKKKNGQRMLILKKRSVSKDSCLKVKREYSTHTKTERRIRSYTYLHEEPRTLEPVIMKKNNKKDDVYERCQAILSEYQLKCEELVKENKRLSILNDRLTTEKSHSRRKCSR